MDGQRALALTLLRVVMGVLLGYDGQLKVFHYGFAIDLFRSHYGAPLPELVGPLVSLLELVGGLGLFVGLFTRVLGVLFALEFLALALLATNLPAMPGLQMDFLLLAGALVLATQGAGAYGLDRPGHAWEP